MRRSVSVKATKEGVVRLPWSLAMISMPENLSAMPETREVYRYLRSSRKMPTHEYVVPIRLLAWTSLEPESCQIPRSIPIAGAIVLLFKEGIACCCVYKEKDVPNDYYGKGQFCM